MKRFEDFINEDIDTDTQKKYVELLFSYVTNKINEETDGLVNMKRSNPKHYNDGTNILNINLRMTLNYFDSYKRSDKFIGLMSFYVKNLEIIESIIDSLRLKLTFKSHGDSMVAWIEFKNDYFDKNKDLLKSLSGTKKFDL